MVYETIIVVTSHYGMTHERLYDNIYRQPPMDSHNPRKEWLRRDLGQYIGTGTLHVDVASKYDAAHA